MSALLLCVDAEHLSPWAMTAHVALREKGLPFEVRRVDLTGGEQLKPGYRESTLTGRVPALQADGRFWLAESTAICEYLEERFPDTPRLYPQHIEQRARARQLQAWVRSDLLALRKERTTEVVFRGARAQPLSEEAAKAAAKLLAVAGQLLAPGQQHLFGAWSIADADLAVMLQRLIRHGDPVPEALQAYAQRQWERPSVAEWVKLAAS